MSTDMIPISLVKAMSRRRFYIFGFVIVAFVFAMEVFAEYSIDARFAIDDSVTVALSIVAIVYFVVTWKKGEGAIKRGNDLATVFGIVILLVTLYALAIETGDSVADDPAAIFFGVLLIVNRFI